jgi:hypothetical protein
MHNNFYYYYPSPPSYPNYYLNHPQPRVYPPVDTKMFSSSIKSMRFLMGQGSILLDKLAKAPFENAIMTAAQKGDKSEVDKLIKSIGLKVPVETRYTPSGVNFILHSNPNQSSSVSCCSLTVSLKWGF